MAGVVGQCQISTPSRTLVFLHIVLALIDVFEQGLRRNVVVVLALAGVGIGREQCLRKIFDEVRRNSNLRQFVSGLRHHAEIAFGQLQSVAGFFHFGFDVATVAGRPSTGGVLDSQVQSVLAQHAGDGQADADSALAVVVVGEQQIGHTLVVCQLVVVVGLDFRQHPNALAILDTASGFVVHAVAEQLIGKGKRFGVLHGLITLRNKTHNVAGIRANVRPNIGNLAATTDLNGALVDFPVKPGKLHGGLAVGSFGNVHTEFVVDRNIGVEQRGQTSNTIVSHNIFSFSSCVFLLSLIILYQILFYLSIVFFRIF